MKQSPRFLRSRLACATVMIAGLWAIGCAGELPPGVTGQGGTTGGGAGTTGTGGTNGAPPCDAVGKLFANTSKCSSPSGCHANAVQGIDLMSPGLVARLVGKMPPSTSPSCASSGMPYLVPNSNPPMGLLLTKLMNPAPCGSPMPFVDIGGALTSEDRACIDDWALAAIQGRISQ